jgi:glucokinase
MTGMPRFVVGLDNGGTKNNSTVLDETGRFLIGEMIERPSRVGDGPEAAISALESSFDHVLAVAGVARGSVHAVGLDTPGPASAEGVLSSKGSTNFAHIGWRGFDIRRALEQRLGLPVTYSNDGNAAALYAHHAYFGELAAERSSVSVIIGTGLGGGVVEGGRIILGAAGMAGELGHVYIPMDGLLVDGQPTPSCNCGFVADAESVASLAGIERNLLPFWLAQYPDHPLASSPLGEGAKLVRSYGEGGDPLALEIFRQQAIALGRLFTIANNFIDPHAYFVGGGAVEAAVSFREWFLELVAQHTVLRDEQRRSATFALVPDLDMAGARGAAIAALGSLRADRGVE